MTILASLAGEGGIVAMANERASCREGDVTESCGVDLKAVLLFLMCAREGRFEEWSRSGEGDRAGCRYPASGIDCGAERM